MFRKLFVLVLVLPACSPSEVDIQKAFEERVAQSQHCESASECTLIYPGCPLGCFVAVNVDEADALADYASELIADYESGGVACNYGCIGAPEVDCVEQVCTLLPLE